MRPIQSASVGNKKEHWDFGRSSGHVRRWAWGLLYPASGGRSVIASPRRTPCLCFDRCAMALDTRPLPAVLCAHPPAMSNECPAASNGGGAWGGTAIPRPIVLGSIGHCASPVALPLYPPAVLRRSGHATAHYVDRSIEGVPALYKFLWLWIMVPIRWWGSRLMHSVEKKYS